VHRSLAVAARLEARGTISSRARKQADYIVLMRMYRLMSGRLTRIPVTTTATAKTLNTLDMLINGPHKLRLSQMETVSASSVSKIS
jgi:hypothetical protein